jgi:pimeloyl-ACP methyl ester carboxylesterase
MQWQKDIVHADSRERAGSIVGNRGDLPVTLWSPIDDEAIRGLILIGHGGSGDKNEDYVVALARGLVRRFNLAAVALDGPVHGERRGPQGLSGAPLLDFAARWSSDTELTDHAVDDWQVVLHHLLDTLGSTLPVGYWGLSMGTILGLPLVAHEPRIAAAVLGLMGATGPTRDRICADAALITVPTMFIVQWDDQLFPRASALELFDRIGTRDKTLVANPGAHAGVPSATFTQSAEFLASHLLSSFD